MAGVVDNKVRAELMRLVPVVASEGRRIVEAIAQRQHLHQTDVEALSCIMRAEAQQQPLSAGALSRELKLTSGATTFLMTRLENAGLITRARDPGDQRRVNILLSLAGRELAGTLYPQLRDLSDAVMAAFSTAELQIVHRFLEATAAAMAAYRLSLSNEQPSQVQAEKD